MLKKELGWGCPVDCCSVLYSYCWFSWSNDEIHDRITLEMLVQGEWLWPTATLWQKTGVVRPCPCQCGKSAFLSVWRVYIPGEAMSLSVWWVHPGEAMSLSVWWVCIPVSVVSLHPCQCGECIPVNVVSLHPCQYGESASLPMWWVCIPANMASVCPARCGEAVSC